MLAGADGIGAVFLSIIILSLIWSVTRAGDYFTDGGMRTRASFFPQRWAPALSRWRRSAY